MNYAGREGSLPVFAKMGSSVPVCSSVASGREEVTGTLCLIGGILPVCSSVTSGREEVTEAFMTIKNRMIQYI